MNILDRITEGCTISIANAKYKVLSKVLYVTQNEPQSVYAKMILEDHNILVVSPQDEIAYFGKNEGTLPEFNQYGEKVSYNGKSFEQVNHDYQMVVGINFGNPLDVEGEVEFWDYENDSDIISVAVVSRSKERADVVAKYISFEDFVIS